MTQDNHAASAARPDVAAPDVTPVAVEVESYHQGLFVGLVHGTKDLPSELDIYADDVRAGSIRLSRNRQESLPRYAGEQVLGFQFDALAHLEADAAISLKVPDRDLITEAFFVRDVQDMRAAMVDGQIVRGRLESSKRRELQGWVFREGAEEPTAELDIMLDGVCIDRIRADRPRGDLAGKFGTGAHGFVYRVPTRYCDGQWHSLSLHVVGTRQNLNESLKSVFLPDLKGLVKNPVFSQSEGKFPLHWQRADHQGRATTCYLVTDKAHALSAPFGPDFLKMQMLEPVREEKGIGFLSQMLSGSALSLPGSSFEIRFTARSEYDSALCLRIALITETGERIVTDQELSLSREWKGHVTKFTLPHLEESGVQSEIVHFRLALGLRGDRMGEIDLAGIDLGLVDALLFEDASEIGQGMTGQVLKADLKRKSSAPVSDAENLAQNSELQDWRPHDSVGLLPAGWMLAGQVSSDMACIAFPSEEAEASPLIEVEGRMALGLSIEKNPQHVRLTQKIERLPKNNTVSLSLGLAVQSAKGMECEIQLVADFGTAAQTAQAVTKRFRIGIQPRAHKFNLTLNDELLVAAEKGGLSILYSFTGIGEIHLFNTWFGDARAFPDSPVSTESALETDERRERLYQMYIKDVEALAPLSEKNAPLDTIAVIDLDLLRPEISEDRTGFDQVSAILKGIVSVVDVVKEVVLAVTVRPGPSLEMAKVIIEEGLSHPHFAERVSIVSGTADAVRKGVKAAVKASRAQWALRLSAGDVLRADFADWIHAELAVTHKEAPVAIVWDHDELKADGSRTQAVFKPGISPELMRERDYVRGAAAVSRSIIAGGDPLSPVFWWRTLYTAFQTPRTVLKIDQILQHKGRYADATVAPEVLYAEAQRLPGKGKLLREHTAGRSVCHYRLDAMPLVSIIIPFKDAVGLLRSCIESILVRSTYENYEIIAVDNNSVEAETFTYLKELEARKDGRLKLLSYPKPFNYSAINNFAARHARGEYLAFVNSDVEVITPDWLERLTGFAAQDGVGFVGAKLHFADGTIQHAGIVIGLGGMAGHALSHHHDITMPADLAFQTRNVSAVTGACAIVRTDRYWDIGGFDETFIIAGNDVELGLRALGKGYRNIIANQVQLFHMEKKTRGNHQPVLVDLDLSMKAYSDYLRDGDPYWNRAISLDSTTYVPRRFGESTGETRRVQAIEQRRKLVKNNLASRDSGYLAMCDLSREEFDANIVANAAFLKNPRPDVATVTWFVPAFEHFFRGGLYTIFRIAHFLSIRYGVTNNFAVCGDGSKFDDRIRQAIEAEFEGIKCGFFPIVTGGSVDSLPNSDLGICTLWTTAYSLAKFSRCKGKFYLVQDYEPCFEPSGSLSGLIEQTYRMGFIGICNSKGVADEFSRYNPPDMFYFAPGVEKAIYHPRPEPLFDDSRRPVRIAFYGRPTNERNGFSLGAQALAEIKRRYRSRVEIVSVGMEYSVDTYHLRDTLYNAGTLPSLKAVADFYRSIDIGLVFMFSPHPSYQPLEYMATGCATVMNVNESNVWLLKDGKNCLLAPATVTGVVDALCELIDNPERRKALVEEGFRTVANLNWPEIQERIGRFLIRGEKSGMEDNG